MNQSIIPPQLKKQKLKLKDNFSLLDLAFAVGYAIISFVIGYNLTVFSTLVRIIIGVTIFMFLMLSLINSEKYNGRIYMIIIRGFIFLAKKKKFTIDSKNNNTSLLMPYGKLHETCLETSILEGGKKWFVGAIEIKGFNITTLDYSEQELRLNQLSEVFRLINCQISLVKLDKPYNLNKNINGIYPNIIGRYI
ncbi:hypothetical protein [Spiroplasma sp. SV19]|uniref:hypothetical protein n=1 Tax=Spiroplasma sp. SV19 TaxID=2570468 RepID=UPI0024B85EE1|nr:hypothetical protein [Spiroplasma sp. SV19]